MAASSADFQWYHDANDDFPIGESAETPSADSSVPLPPSIGPSNRVQQLRGQAKMVLTPPPTIDADHTVPNTTRSQRRHRSDTLDQQGPRRSKRAVVTKDKGKEPLVISLDSDPEEESTTSADDDSRSDDNSVLSGQDKPVSLCCFIWIPTDEIYYRNASTVIVCVAKTSAAPTSTSSLRRGNAVKGVKC